MTLGSDFNSEDKANGQSCPNCHFPLAQNARFCSQCGQDTRNNRKIPFSKVVVELLEGFTDLDTKIWRTLIQLLKNPGRIARDFNSHKRARYVPPFRLFISVSVLFFLLADTDVKKQAHEVDDVMHTRILDRGFHVGLVFETTKIDSATARRLLSIPSITGKQVDSVLKKSGIQASFISIKVIQQLIHLNRQESSAEKIGDRFVKAFSKVLFALLPLFAFLLWLLLNPQKYLFTDVLIYSVYFHVLFFILLTLAFLAGRLTGISGLNYFVVMACVYTIPALRVAFDLSIARAVWTSFALILSYTAFFLFVMVFVLVGSMLV